MHLWLSLPTAIENGAVRSLQWDREVVRTDGGSEVRNSRWSSPLRTWQIAFNNANIDSTDHAAVEAMFRNTEGGTHTFNFTDEREGDTTRVRFDTDLQFTNTVGPFYHLDEFTLVEVRDSSPEPSVSPAISGTTTVGSTLTVSNGTWTDSPTGYTYQWLRDGAEIASAAASTYLLTVSDTGALIGCQVTATNASGSTVTYAAEVGPIS